MTCRGLLSRSSGSARLEKAGAHRRREGATGGWSVRRLGALATVVAGVLLLGAAGSPRTPPTLANAADWRATLTGPACAEVPGDVAGPPAEGATIGDQARADLAALVRPNGAVAAGPAPGWCFAWPRDSAFVAPALAAAGETELAWQVLRFLATVQRGDGGFEARYLLDGSGVPDARPAQADGPGWVLWSLDETRRLAGQAVIPVDLRGMRDRAADFVLRATRSGSALPPPSPDYWEVPERSLTLGVLAPMAAGLEATARMRAAEGDARAAATSDAAQRLRRLVQDSFGPRYERYRRGGGEDAAAAVLLRPFVQAAGDEDPEAVESWLRYQRTASRAGGGLAPGAGWRHDGVSWTPETALVAWTAAASGRSGRAHEILVWLDSHRTDWGSVPEKVRPDGRPAGPAPLAWTAALVVLIEHELAHPR